MGTVRRFDEQTLVDDLLEQFAEELRTSGSSNFALLERCPIQRRRELRSLMNMAALMHWAASRADRRAYRQQKPGLVGQRRAPR
jgi:hypothetical protein